MSFGHRDTKYFSTYVFLFFLFLIFDFPFEIEIDFNSILLLLFVVLFNLEKYQDLFDLRSHLMCVLKRAGLRVYDPGQLPELVTIYRDRDGHVDSLTMADGLGIPYDILIDEKESLTTGFLKLRSRETTLSEIIHITDIPDYLLQIFRS